LWRGYDAPRESANLANYVHLDVILPQTVGMGAKTPLLIH
jgi:hypothetical protein